jgi:hypothetical protein
MLFDVSMHARFDPCILVVVVTFRSGAPPPLFVFVRRSTTLQAAFQAANTPGSATPPLPLSSYAGEYSSTTQWTDTETLITA